MNKEQPLYRVQFINNGKNYQLYVKQVNSSNLFGFVELSGFVFESKPSVVVDPALEKLKSEFLNVTSSYIPLHCIIRIDAVTERGEVKISDVEGNVMTFPYLNTKQ